jgi:gliding motility-associated-like protein
MKPFLLLLLLFCVPQSTMAQADFFNKQIDLYGFDNRIAIISDGSYLLYGNHKTATTPIRFGSILTQIDAKGNVVSSKEVLNVFFISAVCPLRNGGLFVSGLAENSPFLKTNLLYLDATGKTLWSAQLGNQVGTKVQTAVVTSIKELSDGTIVVAGMTDEGLDIANLSLGYGEYKTYFVLTFDKQGNKLQSKQFSIPNRKYISNFMEVLKDDNILLSVNSFVVINNTVDVGQIEVMKYNPKTGAIIWDNVYRRDEKNTESINALSEDAKGNIYAAAVFFNSDKSVITHSILKLDAAGKIIWFKDYKELDGTYGNTYLKVTPQGDIFYSNRYENQMDFVVWDKNEKIKKQWSEKGIGVLLSSQVTLDNQFITAAMYNSCELSDITKFDQLYLKKRNDKNDGGCESPLNVELKKASIKIKSNADVSKIDKEFPIIKIPNLSLADFPTTSKDEKSFCPLKALKLQFCEGDTFSFGNRKFTKTGIYEEPIGASQCPDKQMLDLTFIALKNITIDTGICEGGSVRLFGKTYNQLGTFTDTIKSSLGCDSLLTTINIKSRTGTLDISVSRDTVLLEAAPVQLLATSKWQGVQWEWQPNTNLSCSTCANPIATPTDSITYTVLGTSPDGCTAEKKIRISIENCIKIFVPNAFSPNGDTNNDVLRLYTTDCATLVKRYSIYNRWGGLMYEARDFDPSDPQKVWDGKFRNVEVPQDVYVYIVELLFRDNKTRIYKGDVLIQR